ncbi:MAG: hypothetical protein AB9879_10815 [Methanothrix sp.]
MSKMKMIPALIILCITIFFSISSLAASLQSSQKSQDNGQEMLQVADSTIMILPNTTIQILNSSSNVSGVNVSQGILDHIGQNDSYKTVRLHNADANLTGMILAAGSEAEVSLMPISVSRDSGGLKVSPKTSIVRKFPAFEAGGKILFSLGKVVAGGYILEAREANGSVLLGRVPILVQESLKITLPEKISPGDVLPVKVTASSSGKGNLTVGAIIMPASDYNLTNITVSDKIALGRGDVTAEIKKIDVEDVMNLLPILPEDCTLTYQLQVGNESTLNLITDADWQKGRYVLICAAYDQSSGTRVAQGFLDLV